MRSSIAGEQAAHRRPARRCASPANAERDRHRRRPASPRSGSSGTTISRSIASSHGDKAAFPSTSSAATFHRRSSRIAASIDAAGRSLPTSRTTICRKRTAPRPRPRRRRAAGIASACATGRRLRSRQSRAERRRQTSSAAGSLSPTADTDRGCSPRRALRGRSRRPIRDSWRGLRRRRIEQSSAMPPRRSASPAAACSE